MSHKGSIENNGGKKILVDFTCQIQHFSAKQVIEELRRWV